MTTSHHTHYPLPYNNASATYTEPPCPNDHYPLIHIVRTLERLNAALAVLVVPIANPNTPA